VPSDPCFLDESIDSPEVALVLPNAAVNVIRFAERFARGTEDETWLTEVRDRNYLLFTRDDRWHYHRAELLAIIAARARSFVFTSQGSAREIADAVWRALPKIANIVELSSPQPPYIYKVTQAGIQIVYPSPRFKFPMPR
jgi:hypothetical protein